MTCEDCLKKELGYCKLNCTEPQRCEDFKDKSEWTHLPCRAGDIIYLPWRWYGDSGVDCIAVLKIVFTESESYIETDFDSDNYDFLMTYQCGRFWFEDFGKMVFSTKEQAEEALTKMENEE